MAAAYGFTRLARDLREEPKDEATQMYRDYQAAGGARAHGSPGSGLDDDPLLDEPGWLIEAGRHATDQRPALIILRS